MNTRLGILTLLLSVFVAASVPGLAQTAAAPAGPPHELVIVVVESHRSESADFNEFDRVKAAFTDVFERQNWPLKIKVERLAANTPPHEAELRVFLKGIYQETKDDQTFHAWMTLYDHGVKHDFGIVRFSYYPHPGEVNDDVLDEVLRGAAAVAVGKVEPFLFPKAGGQKP